MRIREATLARALKDTELQRIRERIDSTKSIELLRAESRLLLDEVDRLRGQSVLRRMMGG